MCAVCFYRGTLREKRALVAISFERGPFVGFRVCNVTGYQQTQPCSKQRLRLIVPKMPRGSDGVPNWHSSKLSPTLAHNPQNQENVGTVTNRKL